MLGECHRLSQFETLNQFQQTLNQFHNDFSKLHNNNFIDLSSGSNRLSSYNQFRLLRSRSSQQAKQTKRNFNNSSSPFDGFVEPTYINPESLTKAALFTVAVSYTLHLQCNPIRFKSQFSFQPVASLASQYGNTKRYEVERSTPSRTRIQ